MPAINIYEHSDTYLAQARSQSYATVALPITACWGPCYQEDEDLNPMWIRFTAGSRGVTDFMYTFRGHNSSLAGHDMSYDYALKLLSEGYDVLVKRADGRGSRATGELVTESRPIQLSAKYPGTYGNRIKVRLIPTENNKASLKVYEFSVRNVLTVTPEDRLLESINVALSLDAVTGDRPYISDCESAYITVIKDTEDDYTVTSDAITILEGGTDVDACSGLSDANLIDDIRNAVSNRLTPTCAYLQYLNDEMNSYSRAQLISLWNVQKCIQTATKMFDELTDVINYDWDAVFMSIGSDQGIPAYWRQNNPAADEYAVSTVHLKLIQTAVNSKCGCAFIGTPFGMPKGKAETIVSTATGAVKFKDDLSRRVTPAASTYAQVVGPWCKAEIGRKGVKTWCCPEVAHLLLMINSSGLKGSNPWWGIPAGMIGGTLLSKPEYSIKKAHLDIIQNHDVGVCMNPLMEVPTKGITCFGNSTLWNKPAGTYNALQNLSTRLLVNRVKQRIWDTALTLLFKYNNADPCARFYAGISPLLDEMKALGALNGTPANPWGYRITMNPDLIDLRNVGGSTIIGKVELAVTGVIDTVDVDLFLLPPDGRYNSLPEAFVEQPSTSSVYLLGEDHTGTYLLDQLNDAGDRMKYILRT